MRDDNTLLLESPLGLLGVILAGCLSKLFVVIITAAILSTSGLKVSHISFITAIYN
jgi:hypothetical protein